MEKLQQKIEQSQTSLGQAKKPSEGMHLHIFLHHVKEVCVFTVQEGRKREKKKKPTKHKTDTGDQVQHTSVISRNEISISTVCSHSIWNRSTHTLQQH
jgi:hypothetical protein